MDWAERRGRFRALMAGNRCVHPGSVYDAMSARIAEDLGFEVGIFSGSIGSMAVLGAPDLIVLTLTEFAAQANRVCRAGNLCLLVDADDGYGNALNVRRTVEELETAGVCAMSIEDTVLPRPFGPSGKPTLISIEEGVGKMKAAVDARDDAALVIMARTGAVSISGLDDAIARAVAYEGTGVDALFFTGVKARRELEAIAAATKLPIVLGGAPEEMTDRDYLVNQRVRIALQGHAPLAAATLAVYETLKALREGVSPKNLKGLASSELTGRVARDAETKIRGAEFLGLKK